MTKIPLSPRKGNIKSCHYHTVVKGCLIDDLEVVVSPEVACGFKNDSNCCEQSLLVLDLVVDLVRVSKN